MSITLADHAITAANAGNYLLAGFTNWFRQEAMPADSLAWATDPQLAVQFTASKALPSVTWRNVNEGFSESTGKFQPVTESKYIFGHNMDIDKVLVTANAEERNRQRQLSAIAMGYEFNDVFINGDPSIKELKGLKMRCDYLYAEGYTDQYFDGGSATSGRGVNYDATERAYFLTQIDKLIDVIEGHMADEIYVNSKLYLCIQAVLRDGGYLAQDRDMFGRIITKYQDATIRRIGTKADQTTEIITNSETLSGGTDETSAYAVKYGEGVYLWGIQQAPLEVTDKGLLEDCVTYRDNVSWVVGLAQNKPRSIARAYGFVADSGAS